MPPRFPHRLIKPPNKMDKAELAVFVALGLSVSVGLYEMGTSAMKVYSKKKAANTDDDNSKSAACPMNWGKDNNAR